MEIVRIDLLRDKNILTTLPENTPVSLSGSMYVMRDAGHKLYIEDLRSGRPPFPIENSVIYYMGPTPARDGEIIGSAGPTTSARMDDYAPELYSRGMLASIGKGARSREVIEAIKKYRKVYLAAIGGAGAYYRQCVKSVTPIAYKELGAEACIKITVEDFPCIVKYSACE